MIVLQYYDAVTDVGATLDAVMQLQMLEMLFEVPESQYTGKGVYDNLIGYTRCGV